MSRIKTKFTGVYYQILKDNDKVYYITYKNAITNKKIWQKIGKYSEGIREAYCNQKRNEIITTIRNGEEAPAVAKNKRKQILNIDLIANEYFEQREDSRSKTSDISSYNKHILNFFKNYDFEIIDKKTILKFSSFLKTKKSNTNNKPLAAKTINNILNLFKTITKYAFKNDYIKNDFSKYVTLLDIDNARERFLTKEEIEVLYDNSKNDENLHLLFKLALNTGARLNTLLNIYKKDIDFRYNLITLKDFKNNTTYKTYITDSLKELLQTKVNNLSMNDKLFNSNPARRLRSLLNELFNDDIDFDDRKNKVVFHTLRHTFASHLAINGTPIFTIQKLMNHKDIRMTLRYAKLAPDGGKSEIEKLGF